MDRMDNGRYRKQHSGFGYQDIPFSVFVLVTDNVYCICI